MVLACSAWESFTHTSTHTHIYTYTHPHTHIYTYTHLHIHTSTHTHIYTYTHLHIHTSTHTHIHIHTSTHTHTAITFSQLLSICVHFAGFISAITSTKNRPILKIQKQANCASAAVCFACSNMALVHRSPKLVVWSIQMYGHTIDHIFNGRNNVDY